jgi:hypothetical protein
MDIEQKVKASIMKTADHINSKNRRQILSIYSKTNLFQELKKLGKQVKSDSGKRLVATLPTEVDMFFTKVYGRDYYKDPDFFTKHHSEWHLHGESGADEHAKTHKAIKRGFLEQEEDAKSLNTKP